MSTNGIRGLFEEARRRRVFHVTALYVVGAWVVLQAADLAFPGLGIAESAIRFVWIGAIVGLPIALFFGWRYDITGGRIVRTAPAGDQANLPLRRGDYAILASLIGFIVAMIAGLSLEISGMRVTEDGPPVVADVDPKSIAVLPFVAMTADENDGYFADGLSEELLHSLAGLSDLKVASRTSSFSFKGKNEDLRKIGATLAVAHVLEGSVRRSGDQLRITAQLIQASDGYHVWSEVYDRKAEDIFDIQTDIATRVTEALRVTLLASERESLANYGTDDAEARSGYLTAKARMRRDVSVVSPNANFWHVRATRELLERVVELDPDYADAWALLARALPKERSVAGLEIDEPLPSRAKVIERAAEAIQKAERLDPNSPELVLARADLAMWKHRLGTGGPTAREEAIEAYELAIAAKPDDVDVLESAASFFHWNDMLDEALGLYDRILLLEPLTEVRLSKAFLIAESDPETAFAEMLKVRELHPESPWREPIAYLEAHLGHYHHYLAWSDGLTLGEDMLRPFIWASLGDVDTAVREIEQGRPQTDRASVYFGQWILRMRRDPSALREWMQSEQVEARYGAEFAGCIFGFPAAYGLRDWQEAAAIGERCLQLMDADLREGILGTPEGRELMHKESIDSRQDFALTIAMLAHAYQEAGRSDDAAPLWGWAAELLDTTVPAVRRQELNGMLYRTLITAGRGQAEVAVATLDSMYASGWRGPRMGWQGLLAPASGDRGWFEDNPMLDSIRDDPRFVEFSDKVEADNARMLEAYRAGLTEEAIIAEHLGEPETMTALR